MATVRHLAHAPITEAVIDLRAGFSSPIEAATLFDLRFKLGKEFSRHQTIRRQTISWQVRSQEESAKAGFADQKILGHVFSSKEGEVVQARVDGFSFHLLRQYKSWEEFVARAVTLWDAYRDVAQPSHVRRVACRYINKIAIRPTTQLQQVLQSLPPLPKEVTGTLGGFLSRVSLKGVDKGIDATVIIATEESATPSDIVLLLDVEAFSHQLQRAADSAALQAILPSLRDVKNKLFFGSITEEIAKEFS